MINKIKAWVVNNRRFKDGTICELDYKLKKMLLDNSNEVQFYQSYPPLNIGGYRGTHTRFKNYNMEKYLRKDMVVLDIGSNLGFFSAYLSKYVKMIDAMEPVEHLSYIASELIFAKKIKNMLLRMNTFEELNKTWKYDLILSLAAHDFEGTNKSRVQLNFQKHLDKMASHLNKNGLVLLESHGIFHKTGEHDIKERIKLNKNFKIIEEGITDDYFGMVRKFFWLRKK